MEYTIDLDMVRLRKDKVERVVYSYLKDKFANMIVNVECNTYDYSFRGGVIEFHFFIDVDYCRQDGSNSFYNRKIKKELRNSFYNRKIKKEVSNLCKYILSGHESFGSVSFNSVIHAVITP
jgi:hypothetical protein